MNYETEFELIYKLLNEMGTKREYKFDRKLSIQNHLSLIIHILTKEMNVPFMEGSDLPEKLE
jgi:hypothetical protein